MFRQEQLVNTIAMGALTAPTLFRHIVLMFIGASPGSTGGGIKNDYFWNSYSRCLVDTHKNEQDIEIGKRIGWDIFNKAIAITLIALLYVTFVIFALSVIEKR